MSKGDFPAPADFTTSGITDVAVYRPSANPHLLLIRQPGGGTTEVAWEFVAGGRLAPLTSQ